MIKKEFETKRNNKITELTADLTVVGGGLSGVCTSITAARSGLKVVLIQDRPVLGGNASSEVRLWALGATSHMGNNNRWSRESGLINEILLDNLHRNKEGNPLIFDTILLEKIYDEKNITLLLNTSVYEVTKLSQTKIEAVTGFCSQNSTSYKVFSPLFCDASGDGIIAFLGGASFRMGAEDGKEFDEGFAPNIEDYGNLLGHSLYFYTKDTGKEITYTPPSFAIKDAETLPRIKNYKLDEHGCQLWWVEYGGRLDTVHESEKIKFELWKVVYGIWDYVKNSGKYPESRNLTLEWVGTIPGKRESRRFEGDFMLSQKDIVEQRDYYDAVSFGGWAMDLHPADGIYSKHSSCTQWHSKGVYTIPYRCFYSKDLDNLFLAGRIISATHVAFGSSRVMLTCAHGGQAVGSAAKVCIQNDLTPKQVSEKKHIKLLQLELGRNGQGIPRMQIDDGEELTKTATITVSSELKFKNFTKAPLWQPLEFSTAQLLPLKPDVQYEFSIEIEAFKNTELELQLKTSSSISHFTPDIIIDKSTLSINKGYQIIKHKFGNVLSKNQYAYFCIMKNENVSIQLSEERISGLMTVQNKINKAVSNYGKQEPPSNIAIDSFEFWTPERRPSGKNMALKIDPPIECFQSKQITNNYIKPNSDGTVNAWVASTDDFEPKLTLEWDHPKAIKSIRLFFDSDYDHALESSLMEHPENKIPFIITNYKILDGRNNTIAVIKNNHQAINTVTLKELLYTQRLIFQFERKKENPPTAIFKISVFDNSVDLA